MSYYKCATYDDCAKRQFVAHKMYGQSINHLIASNQLFQSSFKNSLDSCIAYLDQVITLEDDGIENAYKASEMLNDCRTDTVRRCRNYMDVVALEYGKQIKLERDMMHDLLLVKKKYEIALQSSLKGNTALDQYFNCIHKDMNGWQ